MSVGVLGSAAESPSPTIDRGAPSGDSIEGAELLLCVLDCAVLSGHDSTVTAPPPAPSRAEVADIMESLLSGTTTRAAASEWAMRWVAAENPAVNDATVWRALTLLGMVDLTHGPVPDEQVAEW